MRNVTLIISALVDRLPPVARLWLGLACIAAAWLMPRVIAMKAPDVDSLDTLYLVGTGLILASKPADKKVEIKVEAEKAS